MCYSAVDTLVRNLVVSLLLWISRGFIAVNRPLQSEIVAKARLFSHLRLFRHGHGWLWYRAAWAISAVVLPWNYWPGARVGRTSARQSIGAGLCKLLIGSKASRPVSTRSLGPCLLLLYAVLAWCQVAGAMSIALSPWKLAPGRRPGDGLQHQATGPVCASC